MGGDKQQTAIYSTTNTMIKLLPDVKIASLLCSAGTSPDIFVGTITLEDDQGKGPTMHWQAVLMGSTCLVERTTKTGAPGGAFSLVRGLNERIVATIEDTVVSAKLKAAA
jgi:hypothetical protein